MFDEYQTCLSFCLRQFDWTGASGCQFTVFVTKYSIFLQMARQVCYNDRQSLCLPFKFTILIFGSQAGPFLHLTAGWVNRMHSSLMDYCDYLNLYISLYGYEETFSLPEKKKDFIIFIVKVVEFKCYDAFSVTSYNKINFWNTPCRNRYCIAHLILLFQKDLFSYVVITFHWQTFKNLNRP